MIKYSIIIPHKNCPELLKRCLNSIPQRSDLEIIVIDDDSDKGLVDFKKFPGYDRSNVKIILTKEAKGAGYARNRGLKVAIGEWILFADSDDFYEPNAFEILDLNLDKNIDLLHFTSISRNSDSLEVSKERRVVSNESVVNYIENNDKADVRIRFRNSAPWNKVIKNSIIKKYQLHFEEIPMNNDVFFALNLGKLPLKYKVIKQNIYCFTFRSNSISTIKRNFRDENILLITRIRTNQFFKEINKSELKRSYLGTFNAILKRNGFVYFMKYMAYLSTKVNYLNQVKNNWKNNSIVHKR